MSTSGQPDPPAVNPGVHVGQHVGKRCVLGACLDDRPDDLEEHTFQLPFDKKYIPPGVDLRRWLSPVEDEGSLGTCTASALAGAVEYLVLRESRIHADVSRLFIYYNQRLWTNQVCHDGGASLRDGVRVLHRLGVPHERMWPYTFDNLAVQPPESIYRAAYDHRIVDYGKVPVELDALRGCLAGGIPIAVGTHVWSSFTDVGRDGMIRMPQAGDRGEGRHALLLVGYCDRARVFIVRNSWGLDWGDAGYCYMPYQYIANPHWTHSCWAIRTSADVTFEEAEHVQPDLQQSPTPPAEAGMPTAESLFGAPAFVVQGAAPVQPSPGAPAGADTEIATASAEDTTAEGPEKPPSLLSSLGALATGRKSPMDFAFDMAARHSKGLVMRWTGSESAGNMVSGVIGNLAPAVQSGQRLDVHLVGGAVMNAAMGGSPMAAPDEAEAPPAAWTPAGGDSSSTGNRSGFDPGVLTGPDRVDDILQQLRALPPPMQFQKHHWDDTYDEEAAIRAGAPSPIRGVPLAAPAASPPPAAQPQPHAQPRHRGAPPQQNQPTPQHASSQHSPSVGAAYPAQPAHGSVAQPAAHHGAHQISSPSRRPAPRANPAVSAAVGAAGAAVAATANPPRRKRRSHQTQLLAVPTIEAAHTRQTSPQPPAPTAGETQGTQLLTAMPDLRESAAQPEKPGAEQLREHWQSLGGSKGPLGRVVAGELVLSDNRGLGLVCRNGAIVWHPDRGPIELVGTIFRSWSRCGAEGGPLGYPVSPELNVSDGEWTARLARFENGLIIDWIHPGAEDIPPFTLLGGDNLYQAWVRAGAEKSPAGVPLAVPQELPERSARVLPCSNGAVVWTQSDGTQCLSGEEYRQWCARLAG